MLNLMFLRYKIEFVSFVRGIRNFWFRILRSLTLKCIIKMKILDFCLTLKMQSFLQLLNVKLLQFSISFL